MKVTLKDGHIKEFEKALSGREIAKALNQTLGKKALVMEVDGKTTDIATILDKDCTINFYTFDDIQGKKAYWHTASHLMAQAVKNLFPNVKLAIGPATDSGFYYDFDANTPFTNEDLLAIEKEMKKLISANITIEKYTLDRQKAIAFMKEKGEDYKVELIEDLPTDALLSFYSQGDFTDLCAGPHLESTGKIKAFKLLKTAGAYWRGDEKNKMLNRIYGVAFEDNDTLNKYLEELKEAEKRDHNKLGRELKYFTTNAAVGQGLPLLMPKGAKTMQILQRFVEDTEEERGYVFTKTPLMAKSDLYKISGHWDHYKDGMFVMGDEEKDDEVMALRPMTCPFQYMVYKAEQHSYKNLPIRYSETSTLFRREASGEMHGLIRVRQFTLSDAHIICTPSQLEEEFKQVVDLIVYIMESIGISKDITYRFSKWDKNNKEKYIGDEETWESTQNAMKKILDHLKIDYVEADDEAAFYGPKLDIQFKNVFGKEDTLFTVQIDPYLAERFDMYYVDSDNEKKRPYIIHRSSIGCYERTLAMLIEKYAGALPLWVMSEQVRIMNITDEAIPYCEEFAKELKKLGIRATVDSRAEKIGYKIREARQERIPYMLVAGEKELAEGTFAIRKRQEGEIGALSKEAFLEVVLKEIREKAIF